MNESAVQRLIEIMAALRDPASGCPWDREQNFRSIAPYTIEEAYEVVEAIERGDLEDLRDELGDLLFHIVFYARMAEEQKLWAFPDVVKAVTAKLIRRHPHVFGETQIGDAKEQTVAWEQYKAAERRAKAEAEGREPGVLDGVGALPGLLKAQKLQRRAASVGFDWPTINPVADKVAEELEECREVLTDPARKRELEHELGDLLFACVNLARHADVDPETALRGANRRFEMRFRYMETALADRDGGLQAASPTAMDAAWEEAKIRTRNA